MVTTLVDVIKSVATICNFTLEIHLREDQISGKINEFSNGSLSYTGVFENLMDTKGIYRISLNNVLPCIMSPLNSIPFFEKS